MRILIASVDFLPNIGGVSLYCHNLANALSDMGAEVAVLSPKTDQKIYFEQKYDNYEEKISTKSSKGIYHRYKYEKVLFLNFTEILEAYKPEVVLLGTHPIYNNACRKSCKSLRIPFGVLFHGKEILKIVKRKNTLKHILFSIFYRCPTIINRVKLLINEAQYLFANSSYTADIVNQINPKKSVAVIGCGIDTKKIKILGNQQQKEKFKFQMKRKMKLPDQPIVGFVGRLVYRKNVDTILKALTHNKNVFGVIVGDGPMYNEWHSLSEKLSLSKRIRFTGFVNEETKWQYLYCFDVFCMPSRCLESGDVEGFGITFLEASAAGVPVIGTRTGGIVDVIEDDVTGIYVDPEDAVMLADKIKYILCHKDFAQNLISNSQEKIKNQYNWLTIAKKIHSIFDGKP